LIEEGTGFHITNRRLLLRRRSLHHHR
jgi:hypothetical protein